MLDLVVSFFMPQSTNFPKKQKRLPKPFFPVRVGRSSAGLGLFALIDIPRGRRVIEYGGWLISVAEGDKLEDKNRYVFNINTRWDLDGSPRWNTTRYINHACRPNSEAIMVGNRVMITTCKKVKAGEEITYDYGKEYFDGYIKPFGCRCRTCVKKRLKGVK